MKRAKNTRTKHRPARSRVTARRHAHARKPAARSPRHTPHARLKRDAPQIASQPHRCLACATDLSKRRSNAQTCSPRCRKALERAKKIMARLIETAAHASA